MCKLFLLATAYPTFAPNSVVPLLNCSPSLGYTVIEFAPTFLNVCSAFNVANIVLIESAVVATVSIRLNFFVV